MAKLPMFPLGTVLFPGQQLSLHVFEPRYLTMVEHCLGGSPEFGVVLIERGSEVGGHDARGVVGTVARITDVAELPPGVASPDRRLLLLAEGTRRIRIESWLSDDPHPWAEVADWPDVSSSPGPSDSAPADRSVDGVPDIAQLTSSLRRVLAMQSELGEAVADATFDLHGDRAAMSHQLSSLLPVGGFDHQSLLAAASVDDRLRRLAVLLADATEVVEMRLGSG